MSSEIRSERVTIMMAPSEVKAVDGWSFERRIRSRGEAIRRLIQAGLEATCQNASQPPVSARKPRTSGGQARQ